METSSPSYSEPSSPLANFESVLRYLHEQFPKGCFLTAEGEFIDRGRVEKLTTLNRFSEIARAPKELNFVLHGSPVAVDIRGMTVDEAAKIDEIPEPRPPKKPKKDAQGRPLAGQEEYDYEDKKFIAEALAMYELKRALIIANGLVSMAIEGENAEQKRDALRRMFPPQVLDLLRTQILALTSDTIEIASFS